MYPYTTKNHKYIYMYACVCVYYHCYYVVAYVVKCSFLSPVFMATISFACACIYVCVCCCCCCARVLCPVLVICLLYDRNASLLLIGPFHFLPNLTHSIIHLLEHCLYPYMSFVFFFFFYFFFPLVRRSLLHRRGQRTMFHNDNGSI